MIINNSQTSLNEDTSSKKLDIAAFRRAQEAIKAASRGERISSLPAALTQHDQVGSISILNASSKKSLRVLKPFDDLARQAAVERVTALMRTMTQYYAITVGELDDEKKRLLQLPDDRLRGLIKAYEFSSAHVLVMLKDEKAREAAIAQDPKIARFYEQHGASNEEINEMELQKRKVSLSGRKSL